MRRARRWTWRQRRFPGHPILLTEEIQDAAAQQDWGRAERQAQTQIAEVGSDTSRAVDPIEALAGLAMTRGRLAEAEQRWRKQLAFSRAAGALGRHFFGVIQLGYLELRYRNSPSRAIALVDSALRVTPLADLLPGDRRYDELARFYAAAGEPARAREMLAEAGVNDSIIGRDLKAERSWTRGVLALAQGRTAEAVTELETAEKFHVCQICPLPDLGRALEAAGRVREAAVVYERYLTTPWMWRYEPDAVELGWTLSAWPSCRNGWTSRRPPSRPTPACSSSGAMPIRPLQPVLVDSRARRAAPAEEMPGE